MVATTPTGCKGLTGNLDQPCFSIEGAFKREIAEYEKNLKLLNRRYGMREVELAMDGWYLHSNRQGENDVGYSLDWARQMNYETHIEPTTYLWPSEGILGTMATPNPPTRGGEEWKAIYIRGPEVHATVPEEVVNEAINLFYEETGLPRTAEEIRAIMKKVHREVCTTHTGEYYHGFVRRDEHIAPRLNFLADEMREFGFEKEAEELESLVSKQFPLRTELRNPLYDY